MKERLNSKYFSWTWNEHLCELEYLAPNYEFGRQRNSYAQTNLPHTVIYWSSSERILYLVTNIHPDDEWWNKYMLQAANTYLRYLKDWIEYKHDNNKSEHTFHLEMVCDIVHKLIQHHGENKN